MIFNNHSNRIILWGGRTMTPIPKEDNSMWEYDFIENSWEEIAVENGPEIPFAYFGMFYEDQKNEMYLFSGYIETDSNL
jgi:hypothetical protein